MVVEIFAEGAPTRREEVSSFPMYMSSVSELLMRAYLYFEVRTDNKVAEFSYTKKMKFCMLV